MIQHFIPSKTVLAILAFTTGGASTAAMKLGSKAKTPFEYLKLQRALYKSRREITAELDTGSGVLDSYIIDLVTLILNVAERSAAFGYNNSELVQQLPLTGILYLGVLGILVWESYPYLRQVRA